MKHTFKNYRSIPAISLSRIHRSNCMIGFPAQFGSGKVSNFSMHKRHMGSKHSRTQTPVNSRGSSVPHPWYPIRFHGMVILPNRCHSQIKGTRMRGVLIQTEGAGVRNKRDFSEMQRGGIMGTVWRRSIMWGAVFLMSAQCLRRAADDSGNVKRISPILRCQY